MALSHTRIVDFVAPFNICSIQIVSVPSVATHKERPNLLGLFFLVKWCVWKTYKHNIIHKSFIFISKWCTILIRCNFACVHDTIYSWILAILGAACDLCNNTRLTDVGAREQLANNNYHVLERNHSRHSQKTRIGMIINFYSNNGASKKERKRERERKKTTIRSRVLQRQPVEKCDSRNKPYRRPSFTHAHTRTHKQKPRWKMKK